MHSLLLALASLCSAQTFNFGFTGPLTNNPYYSNMANSYLNGIKAAFLEFNNLPTAGGKKLLVDAKDDSSAGNSGM